VAADTHEVVIVEVYSEVGDRSLRGAKFFKRHHGGLLRPGFGNGTVTLGDFVGVGGSGFVALGALICSGGFPTCGACEPFSLRSGDFLSHDYGLLFGEAQRVSASRLDLDITILS
jgi:hypothetical protein